MKKFLLTVFFLAFSAATFAQTFENSWINYNQEYYKIKSFKDGINRVSQQTLTFAGLATSTIDPRKIQLFHNGVEQYIYVEGENDGTFDANDFIEFFGTRNDGSLDSNLYKNTNPTNLAYDFQPTPRYSLFSDTAVYYLTISGTTNGKRVTLANDTDFTGYTPSSYFIKESFHQGTDVTPSYLVGYNRGANDGSIDYTQSEGWGAVWGNYSGGNHPLTINVATDKVSSSGPDANFEICVGGVNNPPHIIQITFPGANQQDTYYNQSLKHYSFTVPNSGLTQPTSTCVMNSLTFNTQTQAYDPDYSMFYWLTIRYPHTYDLEGQSTFKMFVPDTTGGPSKSFIKITNFNTGGVDPILYDLTNKKRITVVLNGSNPGALIDNDNNPNPKECFISSAASIQFPGVSKINYDINNLGHFNDLGALNVDSAFIIISHKSLWSEAQAYNAYRNLHNGNRSVLVDAEELYDQFSYGIRKHPLSIKNFSRYVLNTWPTPAQNLFLIGKSYGPSDFRLNASTFEACVVPSYGVPTSDILLTAGIVSPFGSTMWEPAIPTGRLSALNGIDVTSYLHKVEEYETVLAGPPQFWQKEILHFGGGNDVAQQNDLASKLAAYEALLEDTLFGGHVTTYLKNSPLPIQYIPSASLQAQIDSGVSIMTFFGHASGSGFDLSTDNPENYHNHGRYPMVFANSCFAGDFHTSQQSVSERFVLLPEKAAIAFLASVGLGNPEYLFLYTRALFEHASYADYGASIGLLMKKAIEEIEQTPQEGIKIVANEMSLQGDPSLPLNNFSQPDYAIDESHIKFNPTEITTDLDTFSVEIVTRNYGKAIPDSFNVRVTHTYPNGIDSVYNFLRGRCYYSDTLQVTLSTGGFIGAGVNNLKVEIDLPDSIGEYDDYFNNITTTDFFIISKDIIPVYPPDYAIHPFNTVTLKASTANPMAAFATYKFEIDTIDLNLKDEIPGAQTSPMYRFTMQADSGGVLSWNPPGYVLQDSVVYFWRVANDSIQYDTVNFHWQQSSFIYIPGKTGWAQTHFHQYKNDNYENVRYDTLGRKFEFVNNNKELRIETMGAPGGPTDYNNVGYWMNNSPIEYNGCDVIPAVMVAVLDSISIQPWTNCSVNYGQINTFTPATTCGAPGGSGNCRQRPENFFIYRYGNSASMDSLAALISRVPNKDYIVLYSWFTTNYSTVNPAFFSALNSLGFNTTLPGDTLPFIYFAQKGTTAMNAQKIGLSGHDQISLNVQLHSIWNRGNINSTTLGPSTKWESLHWNQHPVEPAAVNDIVYVNIYGLNSVNNIWDTLVSGIQYQTGKDTSLNWISATQYPYIKLQTYVQDDSLRTPAQMNYWRVYFEEVPECAINPNRSFSLYNDPLQEGDTLKMSIAIENVSDLPMDSLGIKFFLYDSKHNRRELTTFKMDSLRVNQYLDASIKIDSTFGMNGENSLWVEANPYNAPYHQPEKYHFNNLAEIKFNINRDVTNPILDVTFDGIHILNNDIVSGKPNIAIMLHDENKYLLLNDTSKFRVFITSPGASASQKIEWQSPSYGKLLRFTPAALPNNSCRIDWNPTFETDGIYTLEVEAADRSNNESGKYLYRISFEVINHSTITEVLNYPNPFSTSTRFVFTLTGNETPSGMKIQIMTITGKVVREIMLNELGNIHVGRNITEYAWDGKDEYGDRLANGLYLYRVTSEIHGEKIEHRETEIDSYFKRGWGKLYILR